MPDWLTDALLDPELERHQVNILMITMLELITQNVRFTSVWLFRAEVQVKGWLWHTTYYDIVMNTGLTVYKSINKSISHHPSLTDSLQLNITIFQQLMILHIHIQLNLLHILNDTMPENQISQPSISIAYAHVQS